jgi:hypothetical protein
VLEGRQQARRATAWSKKLIAPSYDIGIERSRWQIKAARVSYMMVGVDRDFLI